jgi:hypothetical protein
VAAKKRGTRKVRAREAVPSTSLLEYADALFRTARECCHQHDRHARVLQRTTVDVEERVAMELCRACDQALGDLADAYELAVTTSPPLDGDDLRRRANAVWLAGREFTRRQRDTEEMTRNLGRHSADMLSALHAEFELGASALLALRHACDAYSRARPEAL